MDTDKLQKPVGIQTLVKGMTHFLHGNMNSIYAFMYTYIWNMSPSGTRSWVCMYIVHVQVYMHNKQ